MDSRRSEIRPPSMPCTLLGFDSAEQAEAVLEILVDPAHPAADQDRGALGEQRVVPPCHEEQVLAHEVAALEPEVGRAVDAAAEVVGLQSELEGPVGELELLVDAEPAA